MAIEVFKGKYVTAKDATQYIDLTTVLEGCELLSQVSEKLGELSTKIDQLRELCSKEALSIKNIGYDEVIEEYEKDVNDYALYIDDLSNTIRESTLRVVNRKQNLFNEEAKRQEKKFVIETESSNI